ncbi:MAG: hypothetical protein HS116_15105 [Planctomycetes bacterium]|nr:hypothetical protein [Planctomycetota bacterium]
MSEKVKPPDLVIARIRKCAGLVGERAVVDHARDAEFAALYLLAQVRESAEALQRGFARPIDYERVTESMDYALREALARGEELLAREDTQYVLVQALLELGARLNRDRRYRESESVRHAGDMLQAWFDGLPSAERFREACTPPPGTPKFGEQTREGFDARARKAVQA